MSTFFYQFKPTTDAGADITADEQFIEAIEFYFNPNPTSSDWPSNVPTDVKIGNINNITVNTGYPQHAYYIKQWNTEDVTNMDNVFKDGYSFGGYAMDTSTFNQDIVFWKTGNVTTMANMFDGAAAFDQEIFYWDVRDETHVDGATVVTNMFNGATAMATTYGAGGTKLDTNFGDTPTVSSSSSFFSHPILCMAGNVKVLMYDKTYKLIKDVLPGDKVMDDIETNKFNVVARMYKKISKNKIKLNRIKKGLIGNSEEIICTEHPIWVNNDKNRIFPSKIQGTEIFYGTHTLYDIQYEVEGAFYANDVKVDALPPNATIFTMPYHLYVDKSNYRDTPIYDEDDAWRNKPKMINSYVHNVQ